MCVTVISLKDLILYTFSLKREISSLLGKKKNVEINLTKYSVNKVLFMDWILEKV